MKQHITKKQWDELNVEQKENWIKSFNNKYKPILFEYFEGFIVNHNIPDISSMIEFLGDDLIRIDKIGLSKKMWYMEIKNYQITNDELVDVLWEAVKYKLKEALNEMA